MRQMNAFNPRGRHALGPQQVLSEGSERGDARRRCFEMLKCSTRFSNGRDGRTAEREVTLRDLVRYEDLVGPRPSSSAAPIGSGIGRPHPFLPMAERGGLDTLRGGRGRDENLSEPSELCKDRK